MRGWWCPKEQIRVRNLVSIQDEIQREYGKICAVTVDEETVISAELDRARLEDIRAKLPSLKNRVADAYRWPAPA